MSRCQPPRAAHRTLAGHFPTCSPCTAQAVVSCISEFSLLRLFVQHGDDVRVLLSRQICEFGCTEAGVKPSHKIGLVCSDLWHFGLKVGNLRFTDFFGGRCGFGGVYRIMFYNLKCGHPQIPALVCFFRPKILDRMTALEVRRSAWRFNLDTSIA